jgi:hypothetical protein
MGLFCPFRRLQYTNTAIIIAAVAIIPILLMRNSDDVYYNN